MFGGFECCTGLYWTTLVRLRQQITNLAMLSECCGLTKMEELYTLVNAKYTEAIDE